MNKKATADKPTDKGTLLMFKSRAELNRHGFDQANHYHHRDTHQFTSIPMHTVGFDEAEELVFQICHYDFEARAGDEEREIEGIEWLIRLIAGIAAYEDHEYRQFCAERAIREAFKHTKAGHSALTAFVRDVNAAAEGGDS
jgi:hypothetical protein